MIILNESKVKYSRLDEILEEQLQDIRFSQQVNIIVDLKEVIKKFFRPDIMPEIKNKKKVIEEISSDVINIIGHYRNYFYKKNKYTTFYFLYSYKKCDELIKLMPEYKKEYYEKYFEDPENSEKIDVINRSIQVVEKVISVLPNCMFLDTSDHDELAYTKLILEKIPTNEMAIILSNDEIMYQVLAKNIFIIDLKGIKSELLTNKTVVSKILKRETSISSNLMPLIVAIGGNKKYCFKGLTRVALTKAVVIIEHLIERGVCSDLNSIEIPVQFSKLDLNNKLERSVFDNKIQITTNYKLIRNDENLNKNKLVMESEISSKYKRKQNLNYFLELNAKVFNSYPLQLDMLIKGEKI